MAQIFAQDRNTRFTPAVHAYYALVEALAREQFSVVLRAYRLPAGFSCAALYDALKRAVL